SVLVWLATLSSQLPIVALVGHYPANKLMGVGPIRKRIAALVRKSEDPQTTCGISPSFEELFPTSGQVAQLVLTRSPLTLEQAPMSVRLACLIHAASVHS